MQIKKWLVKNARHPQIQLLIFVEYVSWLSVLLKSFFHSLLKAFRHSAFSFPTQKICSNLLCWCGITYSIIINTTKSILGWKNLYKKSRFNTFQYASTNIFVFKIEILSLHPARNHKIQRSWLYHSFHKYTQNHGKKFW